MRNFTHDLIERNVGLLLGADHSDDQRWWSG
jgi:hypothetical protein